jgi:Acetyltransferases
MIQIETLTAITDCYLEFVEELYNSSFPPEERRNFDELLRLCQNESRQAFNLIVKGGSPAGFLITWNLDEFIFLEHFAVDHHLRGRGIGKESIRLWLSGQHLPVVLEVEPPVHADQKRRILFYEQLGFLLYEVEYWQPPYSPEKNAVRLFLMSYGEIDVVKKLDGITAKLKQFVYR